jgi:alkylation response protein AidB-like acyl-CoA dehydrogenase
MALAHARTRRAFDRTIGEFQGVSHRLADMATKLEAARQLVYRAAAVYDRGEGDITTSSAMAKLFATEVAQEVVDGAIQVLGARGLESGHRLAHLYQVVRAPRIYEGTSEIQRNIIARRLLAGNGPPA